ncbi:MAG: glycyl-radical enzyme activating protein [Eubacteriaceae bacterium]|jgi:pyruvate formate lyase activating enzyme|nr:glycyl-radical enzyme activating protein [Eubacteriaceae bacterium]
MESQNNNLKGMVLRIERSSIHDGDGFRTVVFLKGCPLRCQWCSTPESQSFDIEKTAETVYGTEMTVDEVMKEVRKDSNFFFISKGGLTMSGGEILAQPDFTRAVLSSAHSECINTAIETSFYAPWETVRSVLRYVDTAYVDLKIFSSEMHKRYVGADNEIILKNLESTNEIDDDFRLVVRTPVIPGVNDSEQELESIGRFCSGLKHLHHSELLRYHKLGTATYAKLGRDYPLEGVEPPTLEQMEGYRDIVRRYVEKVI